MLPCCFYMQTFGVQLPCMYLQPTGSKARKRNCAQHPTRGHCAQLYVFPETHARLWQQLPCYVTTVKMAARPCTRFCYT